MHQPPFILSRNSKRQFLAAFSLLLAVALVAIRPIAAAPQGVTIAVTGDIHTAGAKAVSDAILANPAVSALLIVGDTNNGKTTPIESYHELYKGTFDRLLAKSYPCPGNHDQHSVPIFSAYREFWGKAAHSPEMYYSFDLGGWHIVSLDSITFAKGGADAEAQLAWLKRDLAAKPKAPTIAYWHYPYFSNAKHLGQPKLKPIWEALQAHGPALVFTGHNHVYERFAPMDSSGQKLPETHGIQQFVIGPGGATPVKIESDKATGPKSEKFHGGAQHVGYFTLFADGGYAFTIQSLDGKGAIEVLDKGAGNLLGGAQPARN